MDVTPPPQSARGTTNPRTFNIIGLILDVAALFIVPSILFTVFAIVAGTVGIRKGDRTFGLVVVLIAAAEILVAIGWAIAHH